MSNENTKIVITSGEPAGIGPDICINLMSAELADIKNTELYIIADPELITERASQLATPLELNIHSQLDNLSACYQQNKLNIIPLYLKAKCRPGKLNAENSHYVLKMLDLACDLNTQHKVDALVTGPVQKSIINEADFIFTGHTEYLAERTQATPVMMLATKDMRVALATTHLPLHAVSAEITVDSLTKTLHILNRHLQTCCQIERPEILVCGLNPHAGENGNLGDEEINIIQPVIQTCRNRGMKLIGPLPADTLFTPRYLETADAVLAMYHDQGLPVLKYSGFGKAVNITLGLPFIRTSVDHGTALDLAGTGKASISSLVEAINMAQQLSSHRALRN